MGKKSSGHNELIR